MSCDVVETVRQGQSECCECVRDEEGEIGYLTVTWPDDAHGTWTCSV